MKNSVRFMASMLGSLWPPLSHLCFYQIFLAKMINYLHGISNSNCFENGMKVLLRRNVAITYNGFINYLFDDSPMCMSYSCLLKNNKS